MCRLCFTFICYIQLSKLLEKTKKELPLLKWQILEGEWKSSKITWILVRHMSFVQENEDFVLQDKATESVIIIKVKKPFLFAYLHRQTK